MHLAQLCGTPILIWADGQWRIDTCRHWNVFAVPMFVVANDTHRPDAGAGGHGDRRGAEAIESQSRKGLISA